MPELQEEFTPSEAEVEAACRCKLPELVQTGLKLFNQGEYFEAHEVLELAWRAESQPVRELYRGILQVGVAYYHIQRGNYLGAVKMLRRADRWLEPFSDRCCGVDLGLLRASYRQVQAELERLGPQGISQFEHRLFQPIYWS